MYFARDASYSERYAGGGGGSYYMTLTRAMTGQYCKGNFAMIVSSPKINRCCACIHVSFQEFIICSNLKADSNNLFNCTKFDCFVSLFFFVTQGVEVELATCTLPGSWLVDIVKAILL